MKRILLLLILLLPQLANAQIEQYSDKRVSSINVVIHDPTGAGDTAAVLAKLKTKVGDKFSQLDFDEDLKNLSSDYDKVQPTLDLQGEQVAITLNIWPKPLIKEVTFAGNNNVKSSKLRKELDTKDGSIYDRHEFGTAFHKLKLLYVKKGYFEAELSYQVCPIPDSNEVTIQVTVCEGRSGHIKKIVFEGFSKNEEKEILEMVNSKKHFFLTSWLTHAGTYHEEAVEQDRYVALNYLHDQGYADAKVELKVVEPPKGSGIHIVFVADKGKLYELGKITWTGNTLFDNEQIQKAIIAKEGEPYSPEKLRDTVEALTNLYGSKGYIEAIVNYEPRLVPSESAYDVEFTIVEGEQYRVGMVRVFGNRSTQQRVILHESQLVPGEVFDIRKLQLTEQTLCNIGYFENVNVYTVRSPAEQEVGPLYRDVHIEVEETGTGSVGVFGGFSTQESIFGGVELTERNFNLAGISSIFQNGPGMLRGGGEYLRLRMNIGRKQRSYIASWTKPFFMDTPWIIGVDLDRTTNKLQSDDYTLQNHGIAFHANYPFNCFFRMGWHYRLRHLNIDLRHKDKAPVSLLRQARNQGIVSAVGFTLAYDSVDWCHTRGFRSVFESELAGFFGEYEFLSFAYLNAYYYSLGKLGVIKLRGEGRFIQPLWGQRFVNIPIGERLFLGGETTVRGFRPFSLGPQFGKGDDPTGGVSSVLLSGELNHCFFRGLDGFVFCDGGSVSDHVWRVQRMEWSIGFGFRIEMMGNVPIIIGWGYPLNPKNKDDVQHFFFSLGGRF